MDKIRRSLGGQEDTNDETGIITEISNATTFSWSTRIKGFLICMIAGVICSLLASCRFGTFFLAIPSNVGIRLFAVFYSIGNIMALSSTCFLMGPLNQLKKMFAETRIIATMMFLWKKTVLAVLFCCLQFLAMAWYSLTYIPYARDAVKKCVCSCVDV
ncbi:hypothetical protein HELRODRAFT_157395 [Helobdella robusta]|uniref:Vesicle transport protein n=1 Tax=Helobdella robusta TaxID=6412 RepID=T1EMA8_HELRO|nr:hypothetical protein HELRODRAFT_157395 [Helobdella robusta]ESN99935.1 hypothetical protein HELRODRAFT_157395 [Helobdella robusta]